MSLKRKLASAAAVSTVFAAPFVGAAPAMATTVDPNIAYFNANTDLSSFVELAKAAPLCATTFVSNATKPKPGTPVVVSTFPVLTVDFRPTTSYVATIQGVAVAFVVCTLT
jgi:hypothetical protein